MTAVPRVRVRRPYVWKRGVWAGNGLFSVECEGCRYRPTWRGCYYAPIDVANKAAADHAATCPALRLAALLARLEALRDEMRGRSTWPKKSQYWVGLTDAFEVAADDLDTLIAEARR